MDGIFWLNFLMRWLHVGSAVAAIGGVLLMRFAVVPALAGLANGAELYGAIQKGFKRVLHSALGLAIVTGLYNYMVPTIPAIRRLKEAHADLGPMAAYHSVMGVKVLLSFVLFGAAIAMLKPADTMPENRNPALTVNLILGFLILALAAYLRRLWAIPLP
jgi:hypothetical protein